MSNDRSSYYKFPNEHANISKENNNRQKWHTDPIINIHTSACRTLQIITVLQPKMAYLTIILD